jgi:hypothetical protein
MKSNLSTDNKIGVLQPKINFFKFHPNVSPGKTTSKGRHGTEYLLIRAACFRKKNIGKAADAKKR